MVILVCGQGEDVCIEILFLLHLYFTSCIWFAGYFTCVTNNLLNLEGWSKYHSNCWFNVFYSLKWSSANWLCQSQSYAANVAKSPQPVHCHTGFIHWVAWLYPLQHGSVKTQGQFRLYGAWLSHRETCVVIQYKYVTLSVVDISLRVFCKSQ